MKTAKYKCEFVYACGNTEDRILCGSIKDKILKFSDLEFFLKVLTPFSSESIINSISRFRKNESDNFKFIENTEYGNMEKILKITRI